MYINDKSKPLVLLGSNAALYVISDICAEHGINIAGVMDSDYPGPMIFGVPKFPHTLEDFDNPMMLDYLKDTYNFFVATNLNPPNTAVFRRNNQKRDQLIGLVENYGLNCISLIGRQALAGSTNQIGRNVLVQSLADLGGYNTFGDFTSIYALATIGHNIVIGKNCVIQRRVSVNSYITVGDNVFVGVSTRLAKSHTSFAAGTIIHGGTVVRKSTTSAQVISFTAPEDGVDKITEGV